MAKVTLLTLSLVTAPLQAQGPTAVSISWSELASGCEALDLGAVDAQRCRFRLARWQSDYQEPLQQPGLLMPTLDLVLAELPVVAEPDLSLWQRLWAWLRQWLGGGSAEVPQWLRDWQLPETFSEWMLGLSVGACVLLALGIVGNELLQVYRNRAMAHRPGTRAASLGTSVAPDLPKLTQIAGYPLQEQPGLLLHIVLNELQRRALVPRQVGRTHQEILQEAPKLGSLGQSLVDVAQAAERSTYGDWQVSAAEVEPLLAATKRLVASNSVAPDAR